MSRVLLWLFGVLAQAADPAAGLEAAPQMFGYNTAEEQCLTSGAAFEAALGKRLMSQLGGETARDPDSIRAELAGLVARFGPYDQRLLPGLIGLGLRSQEDADHYAAAQAFGRALYVLRANEGLDSLNQLPVIQLLIHAREASGDWRGVEAAHGLMHWLYRRNYAARDPRLLQGLKRLRRWHIDAYNKETGISLATHVAAADRLYEQVTVIVRACGGDPRAVPCLLDGRCCEGVSPGVTCGEGTAGTGLNSPTPGQSK